MGLGTTAEFALQAGVRRLRNREPVAPGQITRSMGNQARHTGIPIIGDVSWGTHFCQFYQEKQDLIDTLVPYFKAGLENNEFCMWVTSEPLRAEEASAALAAEVRGLENYIRQGQLEILDYREWYTAGGEFQSDRVLQGWVDRLEAALARGFEGLRLTGNTFWLEKSDWQNFTEYEARVDGVIGQYQMLAMCTYSLARCGAIEIMDVVSNHAFALIKRSGRWEIIESAERKHREQLEGLVRERTSDLEAANAQLQADIIERAQVEEALRESEARYRLLHETMLQGVVYQGAEGRVISMNAAAESILGWTPALIGETSVAVEGATIREDGSPFPGLEHPSMVALRTGQAVRDVVMGVYNSREQRYRWINIQAVPLFRPGEKEPYQAYTVFDDITERKRIDGELRRASEQRRLALEAAALGSWDYHFQTGEVFWDERCRKLFGVPSGDQVSYGGAIACIHPDDSAAVDEAVKQAIAGVGGGVYFREFRVVWPDGSLHWVASHGRVYFEGEGESRRAVRFIGVNMDITERRQSEERLRQAQKLESLGLLAGGVAHDFNNLLVGVIGNASLAQEMLPADHPAAELVEAIIKTGEQAAHLTRQMLAYSGKGKFLIEKLNLSAILPDMVGLVRPSISKKIALHLDLSQTLPPIEADRGQVQQVFMNLAINAAEAIGSHEGLITVKAGVQIVDDAFARFNPEAQDLRPGEYVFLEVHDTGSGMDESTKAKIFDPFFSTKFTGRGLGLAAVAGIVRGHKGAIMVRTTLGKGSTFTVLFPTAARVEEQAAATASRASLRGSGVVLVVDDEAIVREMAKKALERQGYTVLLADSGMAAIDILRTDPADIAVVLLDLSMPHMNGEETLPELRKIRPDAKVIVSSGYSETETMVLFRGQQVSGFIQKPYTSIGLAEKVKLALV